MIKNVYYLYDTFDNGILVFVGGTRELAKFLDMKLNVLYSTLSQGSKLLRHRYEYVVEKENV